MKTRAFLALTVACLAIFLGPTAVAAAEAAADEVSTVPGSVPVLTSINDLPLDDNNRLAKSHLLYLDTEVCHARFSSLLDLEFRTTAAMSIEFANQYFDNSANNANSIQNASHSCSAVCLEIGLKSSHLLHPLPFLKTEEANHDGINKWVRDECQKKEVGMV